jgi:hypothetical protein
MTKKSAATENPEVVEVAARDDEESRARAANRVETLRLAKEEWCALKRWNADESPKKGPRPSTPNLDLIQKEHDMPASMKTTSKTKSTSPGRARLGVAYVVDGRIMQMKNRPYTLGYLAFEHSPGINGEGRMSTADFRAHLVSLGVADPNAPFAPIVLGNGKQIEGIVLGSTTVSPAPNAKTTAKPSAAKKAEPVGIKPTEKASTPRARAAAKADKKPAAKKAAPAKSTAKKSVDVTPIPKKATSKPRSRKTA